MSDSDQRLQPRDSLFLLARLRLVGDVAEWRVKVRNLSASGLMAEGDIDIQRGTAVQIELRNLGWVNGLVAWVQGNRLGVALEQEIDPKSVRAQPDATAADERAYYHRPSLTAAAQTHAPDPRRLRKI
ncbi:MAG TPA: PilZ domain-containing protein [Novosphingobium sp.]|nr:PilZ domain-containing protein [Novosphingobium sp.]